MITDATGRDWMIYHAVDLRRARTKPTDDLNTRRILLIDPIVWRDGWPRIENNGPSTNRKPAPRVR
jgi:arabinan endo-1,5-alpha-L-arabinosidase